MTETAIVEFARWRTPIENDELILVELNYGGSEVVVTLAAENLSIEVPSGLRDSEPTLSALFLSIDKRKCYRVSCWSPAAFRVLDEHGLTELWEATHKQGGRPGGSTFRVRNHGWAQESFLSFAMAGTDPFSFMIATEDDCLEIVSHDEPRVECVGAAVTRMLDPNVQR